jgi:hypothetical protein
MYLKMYHEHVYCMCIIISLNMKIEMDVGIDMNVKINRYIALQLPFFFSKLSLQRFVNKDLDVLSHYCFKFMG